ncbi:hypothetical protein [Ensifer sp. B1-9]|uniref:hypothetical protein n=1 Tax=Ensifer sp. B1-9 TaxID=3141455 RepID=UPI003D1C263D
MHISRKLLQMAGILVALSLEAKANGPEFQLAPGANFEVVEEHGAACHSLDYVQMNSPLLDEKGWRVEVTKMVNAERRSGRPISRRSWNTCRPVTARSELPTCRCARVAGPLRAGRARSHHCTLDK